MDSIDGTSGNLVMHSNDFGLSDFGADFDPLAVLISGETVPLQSPVSVPAGYIDGGMVNDQFGPVILDDMFGFNGTSGIENSNFVLDDFPSFAGLDMRNGEEDGDTTDGDDDDDEDHSSATTTAANTNSTATTPSPRTPTKKAKVDRSRTLISERRRRGRMKEKLYALRALVPNITKMDKASIVGDAVLYVQELQMQAKKLKAEIADLENTLTRPNNRSPSQPDNHSRKIHQAQKSVNPVPRKILQMDVFQVEERGFYVRLVSNRGVGIAVSLYKALESLISFNVQSSNLASSPCSDRFILAFTLNIREGEPDMNLPNLRLWITGSLLNQGFELIQTA